MKIRFNITVELVDVPTQRHVQDLAVSLRRAVQPFCCNYADVASIESAPIMPERRGPGSENLVQLSALERTA